VTDTRGSCQSGQK